MNLPGPLAGVLSQWVSLYSNHAALRTVVVFAHVGGLLAAGGTAIAADRALLLSLKQGDVDRLAQVTAIARTHRIVIAGLCVIVASGALLFAADVDTFLYSRVFWIKMTLVTLLLVNGAVLTATERLVRQGIDDVWGRLRMTAIISLALWFLITFAGVALTNVG